MRSLSKYYILFLSFFLLQTSFTFSNTKDLKLWYQQPSDEWMHAMPLGNGRLGVMVFGGVETETVNVNEITMWSGQHDKFMQRPLTKEMLGDMRQLFFDGNLAEGNRIASEFLAGISHSFGSHVPLGDMNMNFTYPKGKVNDYNRELDMTNAISTVSFKIGKTQYKREYFCSNPADALVMKFTASEKKSLNFDLTLNLLREATIKTEGNSISFEGQATFPKLGPGGVHFAGNIKIVVDGKISTKDNKLIISDASTATIVFDVRTDFDNKEYKTSCVKTVDKVLKQKYDILKNNHIADYAKLFNRVELYLGKDEADNLPTDVRWKRVKDGKNDVGLDALFFHYGRYLLIAASRENSPLPANLQGIWNDNLACNMGWTNDYHLDINTQQNYWMANVTNLQECNLPLFSYIKDLSVYGEKTARDVYNSRGWTANTIANVWGYTTSGNGVNWGLFTCASAWISSHLWTHYVYTKDENYLRNQAYPILKSNAEFFIDYMVEHPTNGYLMTGPSTSPENSFRYKGDELSLSMMTSSDRQLVYEAFNSVIQSSEILGVDKAFADTLRAAMTKLPPIMIGKNGAIQEWFEDYEEAQPNHRHTTHLLGLYPFAQITLEKTPDLAKAAQKTLEYRLAAEGWEDVEWSRANMICNYARLKDAVKAYESVVLLQRNFTRENLLTISPEGIAGAPYDVFIFDGNEAGGAGIAEMLIQSHEGYIDLLPALPKQWNTGHFKGLCVPGGAEVDLSWQNGVVGKAKIKATASNTFKVKLPKNGKCTKNGKAINTQPDAKGILEFSLKPNEYLEIVNN